MEKSKSQIYDEALQICDKNSDIFCGVIIAVISSLYLELYSFYKGCSYLDNILFVTIEIKPQISIYYQSYIADI